VVKSIRMKIGGGKHVASIGDRGGAYRALVGTPEGKRQIVRIILKWISRSWMGRHAVG